MRPALIVFFILAMFNPVAGQSTIKIITPNELEALLMDSILLFDVRLKVEYDQWHIPHAKNANLFSKKFIQHFENIDKSKPIYLYCRSGHRSIKAGQKLAETGFLNVYSLKNGTNGWKRARKEREY